MTSGMLVGQRRTRTTSPSRRRSVKPSSVVPQPGETSYSLDVEFLQDINVSTGLSKYLFENDTEEAYFLLRLERRPIRRGRSAGSACRRGVRWAGPREPDSDRVVAVQPQTVDRVR